MTQQLTPDKQLFIDSFNHVAAEINRTAVEKGFWEGGRNFGEAIALAHSELSEALEGYRDGNPPDDKVPAFGSVDVEIADCIIRLMDLGPGFGLRVAEALVAKLEYNKGRAYKHGRKF